MCIYPLYCLVTHIYLITHNSLSLSLYIYIYIYMHRSCTGFLFSCCSEDATYIKLKMKCSMKLHRNRYAYAICFDGRTQANYKHLNHIAVEHPYGFSLSYWELSMCSLPLFFFFSFNDQSLKAAADRRITIDHG
jgi:hypothetical protein